FLQADKANPHNLELARRKAYTARTFGRTSAEWAKRTAETPELAAQRELADVIALRGGVPIKVGNETIGAVGVSGSSSEGDEKCAMAGVAKGADQLKERSRLVEPQEPRRIIHQGFPARRRARRPFRGPGYAQ